MEMAVSTVYWIGVLGVFRALLVGALIFFVVSRLLAFYIATMSPNKVNIKKNKWWVVGAIIVTILIIFIPNTEVFYSMFY